jgi:hypothetical protein
MINFQAIGNVSEININNMTFGDSCSYRVFSKCGLPKIVVNSSEVSIIAANIDTASYDPDFPNTDSVPDSSFNEYTGSNGETSVEYPNDHNGTCGKMRRMYVTLTHLLAPVEPQIATSRLLEGVSAQIGGYYQIKFSSEDSALYFQAAISVILVSLVSIFAF